MSTMQKDKTLMEEGLDRYFHDIELIHKILNTPPFSTVRNVIAAMLEATYVKWQDEVMKSGQPEAKLETMMAKAYENCKTDIAKLQQKGLVSPEMRDEFIKNYDGLKEYASLNEGIAGGAALDTLHQVNEMALSRIYELEAKAYSPDHELIDPDAHDQAVELAAKMCIFNQKFAKECEFADSKEELVQGLDKVEKELGEKMPEINQTVSLYKENLKEHNKNVIGRSARAKAWTERQASRAAHKVMDTIRTGKNKTSEIPKPTLPVKGPGESR